MPNTYVFAFAFVAITLAVSASLLRSHVILVVAGLNMATSAAVLILSVIANASGKSDPMLMAVFLISLSALSNLLFCGAIVLVFRSRGRLRMDDYRDLRG